MTSSDQLRRSALTPALSRRVLLGNAQRGTALVFSATQFFVRRIGRVVRRRILPDSNAYRHRRRLSTSRLNLRRATSGCFQRKTTASAFPRNTTGMCLSRSLACMAPPDTKAPASVSPLAVRLSSHGRAVSCGSRDSQGTTFSFTLHGASAGDATSSRVYNLRENGISIRYPENRGYQLVTQP